MSRELLHFSPLGGRLESNPDAPETNVLAHRSYHKEMKLMATHNSNHFLTLGSTEKLM
jgi:hypothetical protein